MPWFATPNHGAKYETGFAAWVFENLDGMTPYKTKAEAEKAAYSFDILGPLGSAATFGQNSSSSALPQAAGTAQGLASIGHFFSDLTQTHTWVRILKVLVGGVLLVAGVLHMSGSDKTVMELAKNAGKVATVA